MIRFIEDSILVFINLEKKSKLSFFWVLSLFSKFSS